MIYYLKLNIITETKTKKCVRWKRRGIIQII